MSHLKEENELTFVKEFNHFGRTNVLSNNVLSDKLTRLKRVENVNQKEHESCLLFRDADHPDEFAKAIIRFVFRQENLRSKKLLLLHKQFSNFLKQPAFAFFGKKR